MIALPEMLAKARPYFDGSVVFPGKRWSSLVKLFARWPADFIL